MSAVLRVDEILTPQEVRQLTDESSADAQAQVLEADGIPYRRRGKRLLVGRLIAREWLAGRTVAPSRGVDFSKVT